MAEYWTPKTQKYVVLVSMLAAGYYMIFSALKPLVPSLPDIPVWATKTLIGNVTLVTIVGGFVLFGIYWIWTKV